jgi:hypothetical protein
MKNIRHLILGVLGVSALALGATADTILTGSYTAESQVAVDPISGQQYPLMSVRLYGEPARALFEHMTAASILETTETRDGKTYQVRTGKDGSCYRSPAAEEPQVATQHGCSLLIDQRFSSDPGGIDPSIGVGN